ncbi:hypothetical protein [Amycolatopsis sp. NBC_00438]|uniref:hypothetical protein n=1 Tax=Amycolatopsis sp. NBC_00438 TaxID=2903558 RepID=UPI002E1A8EF6
MYWRFPEKKWGDIDTPSASEFMLLANEVQAHTVRRRGSRDGQSAKANFIDASRHIYVVAEADRYVTAQRNPTSKLRKPRRHKSLRRALTHRQLLEINTTAVSTGTDPALDSEQPVSPTLAAGLLAHARARPGAGVREAASFTGHTSTGYQTSSTMTYVAATVDELAVVVATLTGEPHPLAT